MRKGALREILPDQVALMCRLTYLPVAATVPAGVLVVLAMGPSIAMRARLGWLCMLAAVSVMRAIACHAYLGAPRTPAEVRRWLWLLLGLTVVAGAVWSVGGTLLLPVNQPVRETLTATALIGVVSVGFSSLAPVGGAYAALAAPFLLPMAAWQMRAGGGPRVVLGIGYVAYLLVMLAVSARTSWSAREQFRLARENRDLAERLRAERDALDRANEELRVASEAKSRFLGHVSHELRTPLTVILGYSDLLLREEAAGPRVERLGRIRSAGAGLLAIVNDLLDVASIEAGRLQLRESDFAPAEVLNDIAQHLRGHPDAGTLEITHSVAADVPARVRADRERLRQVLFNLGVNALRFTARGGVELRLLAVPAADGIRLRGEVVDTGIGIAPDVQARLFKPFSQLSDPTTRRTGGAGLGLAISRSIIERMGGTIGVTSAPAAGSTFWFELPVKPPERAPAQAPAPRSRVATRLGGAVLIAEDVPATRDLLAGFLREAGCAPIAEVGSGPELLDAWRAARFDLMLVDWQMPELDGLSALALIRAEERERGFERTPVVVVTASAMPGDRERCLDAGADAVIEKPIDLERLAQVLARWLTPAPAPAVVPWPGAAQAGGGRAVLVAEDHAGNRELVRSLLAEEGFARVDAVGTGLEAVAAWQQGSYDVMLLDWHMPGIDGLEALRRIRAGERELGRPRAALVMVTGRLSDADRAACFAAGADECVAKPHTPDELLAGIARALQAVGR